MPSFVFDQCFVANALGDLPVPLLIGQSVGRIGIGALGLFVFQGQRLPDLVFGL